MDRAKEALKAELLEAYSQALDEMLASCPEQADFVELEERIEELARKTLPKSLEALVASHGLFPPSVPKL